MLDKLGLIALFILALGKFKCNFRIVWWGDYFHSIIKQTRSSWIAQSYQAKTLSCSTLLACSKSVERATWVDRTKDSTNSLAQWNDTSLTIMRIIILFFFLFKLILTLMIAPKLFIDITHQIYGWIWGAITATVNILWMW